MALGITVVLIIFVASMIAYTTSGQRGATLGSADLQARQYAEGGLNSAYSLIVNANSVSGGNPTAANLIGCNGVSGAGRHDRAVQLREPVAEGHLPDEDDVHGRHCR